jgi:hypothetical protein
LVLVLWFCFAHLFNGVGFFYFNITFFVFSNNNITFEQSNNLKLKIMGVSTQLFVATESKNIVDVMPVVIDAINKWQRKRFDKYLAEKGFDNRVSFLFRDKDVGVNKHLKDYTNGIYDITTNDFRSFNVDFTIHGEQRTVFVTHTCSNDYKDIHNGEKIIFSLGCWGMSREIMTVIGGAVKPFGDVYFMEDDTTDEWVKL